MIFKATDDQLAIVVANAVNASKPMGAGHFHYRPDHEFKPEDFIEHIKTNTDWVSFDYVEGRMVKLRIWPDVDKKGYYSCSNDRPREDYQSWYWKYPTYKELLATADIKVEK